MVPRLNLALTLICREYLSHEAMLHPDLMYIPVEMFADNPQCRIPEVQALSTKFVLYISLIVGTCGAAASPKIGSLSDRYGRRWLLCLTILGGVLNEIITIACASHPDTFHYRWLLLGALCDGICGSFIAAMAVTHSYATDCTAPQDRGVAFGYIQACLFGGIAVGPFIAAFLQRTTGTQMTVFYFALICHVGFMLFIALVMPESLSRKKQSRAQSTHEEFLDQAEEQTILQRLNPLSLLEPLSVMYPRGPDYKLVRRNLVLLAVLSFTVFGATMGAGPVMVFYSGYAFHWGDFEIQMFVGWTSATRVFTLIAILPLINYIFRTLPNKWARKRGEIVSKPKTTGSDNVDLYTITAGFVIEIIQYILFCLASSGKLFFVAGILGSFAGVGSPILSSALSKHVPQNKMGQLMGAIGLLHALGRVICPTVFSLIYANTVAFWPQLVFMVLAAAFALGTVASLFVKPHSKFPLPGDGVKQS